MLLQLTASAYFDFLQQFASLARDPVGYGVGVPRGDGRPVLLIPGFTAGDWSLGTLARWLGRIGYKPYLSGIDLNVGCPRRKVELVGWRVEKIARESGQRVTIIGHSLGGVLGRAIATANPAVGARGGRAGIADSQRMDGSARPGPARAAGDPDILADILQRSTKLRDDGMLVRNRRGGIRADAAAQPLQRDLHAPRRSRAVAIVHRRRRRQLRSVGTAREPDSQSRGLRMLGAILADAAVEHAAA